MKKFIFWSTRHTGTNIVFTESLDKYAQGKTVWQALQHLCETLKEWTPATTTEESNFNVRLKMFQETGINKIEIFVEFDGERYAVRSANIRSFIQANNETEALLSYINTMAENSLLNEKGQLGM